MAGSALRSALLSSKLGAALMPHRTAQPFLAAALPGAHHGIHTSAHAPISSSVSVSACGSRFASNAAAAEAAPSMFCYQCEQTKHGSGCTDIGVCGKTPEVSALQDLLVYSLKGLGAWAHHARTVAGVTDDEVDHFVTGGLFSTLTNVNFDAPRFHEYINKCHSLTNRLKERVAAAGAPPAPTPELSWFSGLPHPAAWQLDPDVAADGAKLEDFGHQVGIMGRVARMHDDTLLGLHELLTYGLKGAAAYARHSSFLFSSDPKVHADFQAALAFLASPEAADTGACLQACLDMGATNLRVMELLDGGHRAELGVPVPASVRTTPVKGKAILVTGHDMADLRALLEQTKDTGVNVYTHGEMLPAHSYPELAKYKHLVGQYGGAWYKQKNEFAHFPGSILVTTNCVLDPPQGTYEKNIFTTGETGVRGVTHVGHHDFAPIIARAKELPGFAEDAPEGRTLTVGFGRETILGAAPQVLEAIGEGNLKHIFLIGGCDGSEPQRRYYANLAKTMPQDCAVLTLGCGKFRLLDQDWGNLPNTQLPRLMDMGQCNDAYGAVVVAIELAKAMGADSVNDLPLSLDISWFEQKAVAVLLTLLHLGVKNIRIGPAAPAFITPAALNILVDHYGLKLADMKHPEEDVEKMIAGI